jgi:CheY-like chemotaxis protein
MDVQMPLMDGFTATRKIRNEINNDIPIIGLTASVFREDIEDCINAGMSDHMGKPYDQGQLFSMIEKWYSKNAS